MKIISFFSEASGFVLGLIQMENEFIWTNDIDKDAVATYSENVEQHIVCDDIKNIDIYMSCLTRMLWQFFLVNGDGHQ